MPQLPESRVDGPAANQSALRRSIGGEKINWVVLDDASDTTKSVTNTRKLVSEDKVDVIIGSSTTPNSLAMREVAAESGTPMISLAASAQIVNPADPKTRWIFKTPQNDALMADAVAISMKANGVTTMGYIGFADAYGDGWLAEMKRSAQTAGIKIVAEEKYNRNDPSVAGQCEAHLRESRRDPDRGGSPAPRRRSSWRAGTGKIYQTHGVGSPDFLRVVGKDGNGAVADQSDAGVRAAARFERVKAAAEYVTKYEQKFGTRTTFGGPCGTPIIAGGDP
jgi:branched-chain amino acid transport system substrate-binding protein